VLQILIYIFSKVENLYQSKMLSMRILVFNTNFRSDVCKTLVSYSITFYILTMYCWSYSVALYRQHLGKSTLNMQSVTIKPNK